MEKMRYAFEYACQVTLRAILDGHLASIRKSTLRSLTLCPPNCLNCSMIWWA
jgi:hypothetical protein